MAASPAEDPILAAMRAQLENVSAFNANNRPDSSGNALTSALTPPALEPGASSVMATNLLQQAQQQGVLATGLAGLLQARQQAQLSQQRGPLLPPQLKQAGQLQQAQLQQRLALQPLQAPSSGAAAPSSSSLPAGTTPVRSGSSAASASGGGSEGSGAAAVRPPLSAAGTLLPQAQAAQAQEAERLRCHLHKRPKESCRFCKKWQDFVNKGKEDKAANREAIIRDAAGPLRPSTGDDEIELAISKTFGLPPLFQSHITESQHFKSLTTFESLGQVMEEIANFADTVEPYLTNSSTIPSPLFCCVYRLFTMGMNARQLRRLIDNVDNTYVRCAGALFVRFGLNPDQLWSWLGEYVLDEEEVKPAKDAEWITTFGEYVEGLLSQDRYYSVVLPRLPMSTKRQLEAKMAQIPQFRKRTQSNQRLLDVYRQRDVRVEACGTDGQWLRGVTVYFDETAATRPKVRVRLDSGAEEIIHLGKVILTDQRFSVQNGYLRPRRQRSRSRSPQVDWSREKGKTGLELLGELRSRNREKAVCTSGKEYAKKPVGFKVACALPREQGAASHRLMEDETFVPMRRDSRKRSPSPAEQRKAQPSAEHQARMQQLFEKYGMAKGQEVTSQKLDVEGPDVMRLG